MNQVVLFGRLTKDPELRYTPQGKPVVDFALAVNRYGDNDADFFDHEAWEKQAENISGSCKKGHRLLTWGRLKQERWTDPQGAPRTRVKIVVSGFSFIEPPLQGQGQQPAGGSPGYSGQPGQGQGGYAPPNYGPPGHGQPPGYAPPAGPGQYGHPPSGGGQQPGGYHGQPGQGQGGTYQQGPGQGGPPSNQGGYPPNQGQPGYSGSFDTMPF